MSKLKLFFCLVALIVLFGASQKSYAQNGPVMYFCSSYGSSGEIDISDRFTTGYLTVMVKCDYALGLKNVNIQFDKSDLGPKYDRIMKYALKKIF